MAESNPITQDLVRDLFDYRADGRLVWRRSPNRRAKAGDPAGSLYSTGYRQIGINRKYHLEHRVIFLWHHGYLPREIDHANGRRDDNRIENLRDVSRSENNWNMAARGVCRRNGGTRWEASITVNGRYRYIGSFKSEAEARAAYLAEKALVHVVDGAVANCSRS